MNSKLKIEKYISTLQLYHRSTYDLFIDKSSIVNSGLGVFTKNFIPKNSLIDEYYGEYIENFPGGEYFFKIDENCGINAINTPRCYMAMLNDASYRPTSKRGLRKFVDHNFINNCYFVTDIENKKVRVYSLIDIQYNTELFISYGSEYWNDK